MIVDVHCVAEMYSLEMVTGAVKDQDLAWKRWIL